MSTRTSVASHVTPIAWRLATVSDVVQETSSVRTLVLDVPGWPGHRAGQHVDVRVTAEDGYQAQRSYSIASAPEDTRLELTIERLDDGEVSPYLTEVLRVGDRLEFRGPIGGYFVWEVTLGGPLLLVGGGSGMVPLMALTTCVAVFMPHATSGVDETLQGAIALALGRLADGGAIAPCSSTLTRPAECAG